MFGKTKNTKKANCTMEVVTVKASVTIHNAPRIQPGHFAGSDVYFDWKDNGDLVLTFEGKKPFLQWIFDNVTIAGQSLG